LIAVRAVPLTIMMFSVEGCQCHGTEQPAPLLIFNMDASLPGSPCCAAITKHSGVPGIWTIGRLAARVIFVSCACNDIPNPPTEIASIIEQQDFPKNDFMTPPALRQSQWNGWRLFPGQVVYPRRFEHSARTAQRTRPAIVANKNAEIVTYCANTH
jgi:hypothetical protein